MNKLRTILAAALLTMPVVALNASTVVDVPTGAQLSPTQPVASCCWMLIGGRWYCVPC
jgi:hypothetical protein